ncbi:MAG: transporter [Candidatus Riflebacteria bacterium]|nr:transporter [Candidatus Riflebacteria bacterium]
MKKNTAIAAIVAALLIGSGLHAQSMYGSGSSQQLQNYGFSKTAQTAVYGTQNTGYELPIHNYVSADVAETETLPPITMSESSSAPKQMSLPPITVSESSSPKSSNIAKPVTAKKSSKAPVVKSKKSSEVYSQDSVSLPPVTTLPVPSRTVLPPLYSDTMMTVPIEESVTRVLACNMTGYTGLIETISADVSKAGSFKMGFHSSWFDIDRVYDRTLSNNESGDMLTIPLYFNYALTDDLEVVYNIPIVDYTIKSRILWRNDFSESGCGDSTLGFKYKIFDNPTYQTRGALGVAFKFPTGSDDKGLGTGETDFTIFTAFSKNYERIVAHLNLGYTMTGDPNTQFYPDGLADKFFYNIGIEYPHTHNVTVMAEVAGEDWGAEGNKVDIIPGLRYSPTENFSFEVAVPISVTNDQRFGYNYRLVLGLNTFFQ